MEPDDHAQSRWQLLIWLVLGGLMLIAFGGCPPRHFMTPFREGQTALLAAELSHPTVDAGSMPAWLKTPTPVFGYPWNLPMEFPLYQQIVAGANRCGVPLDLAGRAINAAFTVGAVLILLSLGRELGLNRRRMRVMAMLALTSPLYFAYGTGFLIEGCALFFALLWLWLTLRAFRGSYWAWGLALLASVVAGVVKPTTWVPAAAGLGLYTLIHFYRSWRIRQSAIGLWKYGGILATALLTVVIVKVWVDYSDAIKETNPLGGQLTSAHLSAWNYGTLGQKLSPIVWSIIGAKTLVLTFGFAGVLVPFVAIGGWRRLGDVQGGLPPREMAALLSALGGAVAAPFVFTNLHLQHDYYQFANAIYLWAALAIGLDWLSRAVSPRTGRIVIGALLVSCGTTTASYILFRKALHDPADEAVLAAIARLPAGRPVAYVGFDYTGKLPYYSRRPALMTISAGDLSSGRFDAALKLNRSLNYEAVVAGGPQYLPAAMHAANELGIRRPAMREIFPRTFIVVSSEDVARIPAGVLVDIDPGIAAAIKEVAGEASGYRRFSIERDAAGEAVGMRLILKRRDQLFVFRSRDFSLTRIKAVE